MPTSRVGACVWLPLITTPSWMSGCSRLLVVTAFATASSPAFAHDPPEVMRIAWSAPQSAVFQTQRGFIVGDTAARSYRWACVEGLEAALGEQPGFVVLPGDVWMVATEHGLLRSSDQGCHWNAVERFGAQVASAVALAPDDSKHVFVALAGAADGGLYESRDAGASWQKRMRLAPDDYVAQILIAPSAPSQIDLSGLVLKPRDSRIPCASLRAACSTPGSRGHRYRQAAESGQQR